MYIVRNFENKDLILTNFNVILSSLRKFYNNEKFIFVDFIPSLSQNSFS